MLTITKLCRERFVQSLLDLGFDIFSTTGLDESRPISPTNEEEQNTVRTSEAIESEKMTKKVNPESCENNVGRPHTSDPFLDLKVSLVFKP